MAESTSNAGFDQQHVGRPDGDGHEFRPRRGIRLIAAGRLRYLAGNDAPDPVEQAGCRRHVGRSLRSMTACACRRAVVTVRHDMAALGPRRRLFHISTRTLAQCQIGQASRFFRALIQCRLQESISQIEIRHTILVAALLAPSRATPRRACRSHSTQSHMPLASSHLCQRSELYAAIAKATTNVRFNISKMVPLWRKYAGTLQHPARSDPGSFAPSLTCFPLCDSSYYFVRIRYSRLRLSITSKLLTTVSSEGKNSKSQSHY